MTMFTKKTISSLLLCGTLALSSFPTAATASRTRGVRGLESEINQEPTTHRRTQKTSKSTKEPKEPKEEKAWEKGAEKKGKKTDVEDNDTTKTTPSTLDWDLSCQAVTNILNQCLDDSVISLRNRAASRESCKLCIMDASSLATTETYGLNQCIDTVCHGCSVAAQSYYECGKALVVSSSPPPLPDPIDCSLYQTNLKKCVRENDGDFTTCSSCVLGSTGPGNQLSSKLNFFGQCISDGEVCPIGCGMEIMAYGSCEMGIPIITRSISP